MTATAKRFATFFRESFKEKEIAPDAFRNVRGISQDLNIPVADAGLVMVNTWHRDMECRPGDGGTSSRIPKLGDG